MIYVYRGAFVGVAELLAAHADAPTAASYHRSLGNLVDALAERGVVHIDRALAVLTDMQQQVRSLAGLGARVTLRRAVCCCAGCKGSRTMQRMIAFAIHEARCGRHLLQTEK